MQRIQKFLLFLALACISAALVYFPYITYTCAHCTKDSTSILEIYSEISDMESVAAALVLSTIWLPMLFCIQAFWLKTPLSDIAKVALWIQVGFAIIGWFAGAFIMSFHVSSHDRTSVFAAILIYEAFFALDMMLFLMGFSGFGITRKMFSRKT